MTIIWSWKVLENDKEPLEIMEIMKKLLVMKVVPYAYLTKQDRY